MFHAWQFDAQGQCWPFAAPGRLSRSPDHPDVPLGSLPCEVAYGGFVWVHLEKDAPPIADHFGEAFDSIRPHLEAEPLEVFHHHKAIAATITNYGTTPTASFITITCITSIV